METRRKRLIHAANRLLDILTDVEVENEKKKLEEIASGHLSSWPSWPYPEATSSFQCSIYFPRIGLYLLTVIVQLEQVSDAVHVFAEINDNINYITEDMNLLRDDMFRLCVILRNLEELQLELNSI